MVWENINQKKYTFTLKYLKLSAMLQVEQKVIQIYSNAFSSLLSTFTKKGCNSLAKSCVQFKPEMSFVELKNVSSENKKWTSVGEQNYEWHLRA